MVLNVIHGDHPLGDSQVETNFILSTIHGGVVRSLDVHLETLKKHSSFFRGVPPDEKSMKVNCPLDILRHINEFYMTGMCRVSDNRLKSLSHWCGKLKFDTLHKEVQKFISPLQEVKVAKYVISIDEEESQMTTESDAVSGSSLNTFKREVNDEQTYIVHKRMKGNSEEKPATLANEVGAQRQAEAFGSTAHTADSYLVSNEIGASSTIEECIDLTSDEEESERALESDGFNESSQNTFEANRKNGKADNIAQILNENDFSRILMVATENIEAKATASTGQSENDKECQNEHGLRRYATRSTTLKAKHADMEESDSSEEDTAFNSESSRSGRIQWTESVIKVFLSVWLKWKKHRKIIMREELDKKGLSLSSHHIRQRRSDFRRMYEAHMSGTEEPDIKPHLSLMKEILDAEKSSGRGSKKGGIQVFEHLWTKEMIDVLLKVWVKYAERGPQFGSWDNIANEVVDTLAQMNINVTPMQVITKKRSLLQKYRGHINGKNHYSVIPHLPLLDKIHSLTKK